MRINYYLFDKLIYNYTELEYGVEIRRNDGQDIDEVKDKLESNCDDNKAYMIYAENYHIIEDFETNNKNVFLIVEYNWFVVFVMYLYMLIHIEWATSKHTNKLNWIMSFLRLDV